jgi:tetratricopeptide (TPR) repeat protein
MARPALASANNSQNRPSKSAFPFTRSWPSNLPGKSDTSFEPMSDWNQVQELFLACVDLAPEEQEHFLRFSCPNPATRAEVESLLASDLNSGTLIESAISEEANSLFDDQAMLGERLGIYRIIKEIGRGGMGSVYLASRDDKEFQKEVALKIVKRGMDTADVLQRFRYERQILANLEHPYIARLFDGGSTEDGVPFFVMEYVEGCPLDAFCRQNSISVTERCELFLRILDAVAYAHRNLVVHRDLKPSNILVTADSTPKLLDFGVAKLLNGEVNGNHTRTAAARPYTPAYASPEQVLGLPITTATDIYSLGAILYELLSGERAQTITVQTPSEIERVVCNTPVPRPSLHARGLSSDLDNIVLMAMRKEPDRRYQSAAQFAEDLRRHLEGKPILARQSSLRYRAVKFISRNRLLVAATSTVILALVAGLLMSLAQTRRAEASERSAEAQRLVAVHQTSLAEAARLDDARQTQIAEEQRSAADTQRAIADRQRALADVQRDEAQREKAVADHRAKDILGLANRTLFDVHDSIAKLPGALPARQILVKTTLDYLQNLQQQAGLDDEMRQTLCGAYYRVALMQGDATGASLQDSQAAESNLLKGQAVLMPAYNRHPDNADLIFRLLEVRSTLADLTFRSGRREEGIQIDIDLLPIAHRLALLPSCGLNCKIQEAALESSITYDLATIDPTRALPHADHGIAILRDLITQYPNDATPKQGLGTIMAGAAGIYKDSGDLNKAADYFQQSITAREELLRATPNDGTVRRNLLVAYGNFSTILGAEWSPNLNRLSDARLYANRGVVIARGLAASDPDNVTARHDLGMILGRLGMIEPTSTEIDASLQALQEARALMEPIALANPKSADLASQLGMILEYQGRRQDALGLTQQAIASCKASFDAMQPFLAIKNSNITYQTIGAERCLAIVYASAGDRNTSLDFARKAFELTQSYIGQPPFSDSHKATLASAWATLALTQSRLGDLDNARQSAQKAVALWDSIQQSGLLSVRRKEKVDTRALLASHDQN